MHDELVEHDLLVEDRLCVSFDNIITTIDDHPMVLDMRRYADVKYRMD